MVASAAGLCPTNYAGLSLHRSRYTEIGYIDPASYGGAVARPVIPAEWCVGGRELGEPRLHPSGRAIGYLSGGAGSVALWWHPLGEPEAGQVPVQLTSVPQPRSARGLGGGVWAWTAAGDGVVFVATDGQVWLQPLTGGPRRITDHPDRSVTAPLPTPDGEWVLYAVDDAEIWRAPLVDGPRLERLDDGTAGFVMDPWPISDGSGAQWVAWDVPDMPWDASRVQRRKFASSVVLDFRPGHAIQQPRTLADGREIAVRDDDGWLNVWLDGRPVVSEQVEHAAPMWGPGQRSFAASPDGDRVAFTRNEDGFARLYVADVAAGNVLEVGRGVHGQLGWVGERLAALRSGARTPPEIVVYDTATWSRTTIAAGAIAAWRHTDLAEPELVTVPASDPSVGLPVPARFYGAVGEPAGLLCWVHGGPTDQWQVTFIPRVAYWQSRGWNVLVPDHRGSTGHGRAFQQALRGQWGIADVADVSAAIALGYRRGWGTPQTTFVVGGSAGGFTALEVLAGGTVEVAGVAASYPVTDLVDLGERSHRFERHYNDSLVGPVADASATLRTRSPIDHPQRFTGRPILIVHGDNDPVVPVDQSRRFADAVNAAGGRVELHVYAGEGHGLRQPANQLDEYRLMGDFFARHGG